jgi:hypothetical protein
MALELLEGQIQHFHQERVARGRGRLGPLTLSVERKAYHDLEALVWVLVYAMMIRNYNALTDEADRKTYKKILDTYFGHGSASIIIDKRHAMMSLGRSHGSRIRVSSWFSDPQERKFFTRCMTLISKHDKEEEEDCGPFAGETDDDNPPWDSAEDESNIGHDEDVEDKSGTYAQGNAAKVVRRPVAGPRTRPPVITYESVLGILKKTIDEL